jgi:2-hydroxycyclohexanecarboxyl-CoA dehydrogenase
MAAIVMFSRTVAMEVKRYGIRVNALTPSLVTGTGISGPNLRAWFLDQDLRQDFR